MRTKGAALAGHPMMRGRLQRQGRLARSRRPIGVRRQATGWVILVRPFEQRAMRRRPLWWPCPWVNGSMAVSFIAQDQQCSTSVAPDAESVCLTRVCLVSVPATLCRGALRLSHQARERRPSTSVALLFRVTPSF